MDAQINTMGVRRIRCYDIGPPPIKPWTPRKIIFGKI
jgi:hypothetical protein